MERNVVECPAGGNHQRDRRLYIIPWKGKYSKQLKYIPNISRAIFQLAVAALCGLISLLLLRHRDDVNFYVIPCVFIAAFSFFIAHIVLSLYEVRLLFT